MRGPSDREPVRINPLKNHSDVIFLQFRNPCVPFILPIAHAGIRPRASRLVLSAAGGTQSLRGHDRDADPDQLHVRRTTERVLFLETGLDLAAGFAPVDVNGQETWVISSEGGFPESRKDENNRVLLARIVWNEGQFR